MLVVACMDVGTRAMQEHICSLYTSDAADERYSLDLVGPRNIQEKKNTTATGTSTTTTQKTSNKR